MRHHHGYCGYPPKVVHPTKYNCVKQCNEDVVEHIHPSHTAVHNHHTTINKHVFPHSTSVQNTNSCVDVYGGSYNVPPQVGGAMAPGYGPGQVAGAMAPGYGPGQVAGAMAPGYGPGQVAGAMAPGMGYDCHKPKHCKHPHKW